MVSAVLEAGADFNKRDSASNRSPLCQALSGRGNEAVARGLVLAEAVVNFTNPSDKCSLLNLTVSNEYEQLVEDLSQKGADPNTADKNQTSPLACAASRRLAGTMSNLLKHGVDKDKLNGKHHCPR